MKTDRKKYRWKERKFRNRQAKRRQGGVLKHDPLQGSTQAKGIVVEKVGVEAKQPNSGIRKAVKISLIRSGNKLTADVTATGSITENDSAPANDPTYNLVTSGPKNEGDEHVINPVPHHTYSDEPSGHGLLNVEDLHWRRKKIPSHQYVAK